MRAGSLIAASHLRESTSVVHDDSGHAAAVHELAFALALDEPGFLEDLQVMRDGGRGDTAHGHDLTAIHVSSGGYGLKDPEAGLVRQSS